MFHIKIVLGLVCVGLVSADVRDALNRQSFAVNSFSSNVNGRTGGTFIANNGQVVKQSFNPNGDASFSSKYYNSGSRKISCSAPGQICAPRQICSNGYIKDSQLAFLNSRSNSCDSNSEVCCRIQAVSAPLQEQSASCNQPNSACVPANQCVNGYIPQQVEKFARSAERCYAPEVCCRYGRNVYSYPRPQDNSVAAAQSPSTILTNEGYVVKVPSNQYLPVRPESSNVVPVTRPTTTTRRTTKLTTPRPTYLPPVDNEIPLPSNENPNIIRPIIQETAITIASGCPAAMNCTPIEYCTSTGVISKTPVVLTAQQELFRVPMTDCRDPKTGISGKCCRDPDYVDPWPVSILGQYNAEILGFDDGSYKPERRRRNQGKYVRPVA